jgi:hypothetical protein
MLDLHTPLSPEKKLREIHPKANNKNNLPGALLYIQVKSFNSISTRASSLWRREEKHQEEETGVKWKFV